LWVEIGLDRNEELEKIENLILGFKNEYIENYREKCDNFANEIEEKKLGYINILTSMGETEDNITQIIYSGNQGSLKERNLSVLNAFEPFQEQYEKRMQLFHSVLHELSFYYDFFNIPDEEREIINYSDISLSRFHDFSSTLRDIKDKYDNFNREKRIIAEQLEEISNVVGIPLRSETQEIMLKKQITIEELAYLKKELTQYKEIKITRVNQIAELALEMTTLWDSMNVSEDERKKFVSLRTKLTYNDVMYCVNEIQRLIKKRTEQLQGIISKRIIEIKEKSIAMGLKEEEIDEMIHNIEKPCPDNETEPSSEREIMISQMEDPKSESEKPEIEIGDLISTVAEEKLNRYYENLERLYLDISKKYHDSQPIIELIKQRETIVSEHNICSTINTQTKAKPDHAIILRLEKAKRRYQSVLPRLDKKLKVLLDEYRNSNGTDFLWDGETYSDKILDVKISSREKKMMRESLLGKKLGGAK